MLGDDVRVIEWNTAFPIPGLSPFAQRWIRAAKVRRIPKQISDEVYAERAARVRDLAGSVDVGELLGARVGIDSLAPLQGRVDGRALAFGQHYQATRSDPDATVAAASVTFFFGADGVSVGGILSGFQPEISPPRAEVAADEAVVIALDVLAEQGAPALELISAPTLLVDRKPLPLAGVRSSTVVRRANDAPYYSVGLFDPTQPDTRRVQVNVDAVTGEPTRVYPLSSHGGVDWVDTNYYTFLSPGQLNRGFHLAFCKFFDGSGKDVDGMGRNFSTTFVPGEIQPVKTDPYYKMVSCNESPDRLINYADVQTHHNVSGFGGTIIPEPFKDFDNVWDDPDPLLPHAVNSQFWGERIVRYFKRLGYTHRVGGEEIQYRALLQKMGDKKTNYAEFIHSSPNGVIRVHPPAVFPTNPAASLTTSADPAWLAHEFAHSVGFDAAGNAGALDKTSESGAIAEGLADCFAMGVLNENFNDLNDQYKALAPGQAPWLLTYGSFVGDFPKLTAGFPNLNNPAQTWFGKELKTKDDTYTYWAAQQVAEYSVPANEWLSGYERNSTILGGVCKMLVTGGQNPEPFKTEEFTGAGHESDALGGLNNQALSYERLGQLLLANWVDAKQNPQTFEDLLDTLSATGRQLAKNEWLVGSGTIEERIRRNFAEYGFGRAHESEPDGYTNSAGDINVKGDVVAANLIATGRRYFRAIQGEVCCGDEDFFALNEQVREGDFVKYEISWKEDPQPTFEVRLYRGVACDIHESDPKNCTKQYQFYPPIDPDGNVIPNGFVYPSSAEVKLPPSAQVYWPVYVGVRIKPDTAPATGSYTLTVRLSRKNTTEPYE